MPQFQPTISDTMLANLTVILNNSPEDGCAGTGIKIKEYPKFANYDIECTFKGIDAKGKPFSVQPLLINRFLLDQDFIEAYMDHIEINISMRASELLLIFDGYQKLTCDVILRHIQPTTGIVKGIDIEGEPVYTFSNYKVIFKNKQDIRKKIPKKSLIPEDGRDFNIENQDMLFTDISLQLIKEEDYILRVKSFSFQLTESTVKDAILFMAHSCGISKIALIEPDNVDTISNIIIPPTHTLNTGLNYVQEIYGIYNKGLGFYYTDGILYVYPRYETNSQMPKCPKENIPKFYYIGGSKYPNLEVNHAVDINNNTHIVVNAASINKDMVDMGIENDGTAIMMMHADRVIDAWRSMAEAPNAESARIGLGKMNVSKSHNTSVFALTECERKRIGIDPNITIAKYVFDQCNTYRNRLPINRYKRSVLQTAWENAIPYTFKPGYKVIWNYDGEAPENREKDDTTACSSMYCSKPAVMDSVSYLFTKEGKVKNRWIYKCVAGLTMNMELDKAGGSSSCSSSSNIDEASSNKNMGGGSAYKLSMGRGGGGCPLDRLYKELKAKDPSQLTKNEKMLLEGLEKRLEEKRQRLIGNGTIFR